MSQEIEVTVKENLYFVKHQQQTRTQSSPTWCKTWLNKIILGIRIRLRIFFDLSEIIDNNLSLSICSRQDKLRNWEFQNY
jgi:hypothetical protein